MQIERVEVQGLTVNPLPDGSRVITDSTNERVFALNPAAGAAWDACTNPTTLTAITEDMRHSFDLETTEDFALQAVRQLETHSLVRTSEPASSSISRRGFIATLGAAAVPLVVALTLSEQRALAFGAKSAKPPKDPKDPKDPKPPKDDPKPPKDPKGPK